ncbi:hypothetical protein CIHG_05187 [Coccidioides immitis H538.4]|uniref:Uncharacterized protein n=3 Tax=Coccidioides immitis TaxID=5501 RepID=A0A0J8R0C3_COCIT|nr:hypothetical protein CIRG_08259 [Coccidioides immitis RMSCC 2394]KMU78579.1 hypothetical protein CISG_01619 [Coccidioides immitis RMSCC 3703]KMU87393.1 hypothetical protein CIHG_05187 [Coccidioides immitis H538.4]
MLTARFYVSTILANVAYAIETRNGQAKFEVDSPSETAKIVRSVNPNLIRSVEQLLASVDRPVSRRTRWNWNVKSQWIPMTRFLWNESGPLLRRCTEKSTRLEKYSRSFLAVEPMGKQSADFATSRVAAFKLPSREV